MGRWSNFAPCATVRHRHFLAIWQQTRILNRQSTYVMRNSVQKIGQIPEFWT